jgi:hypothetical protein
LDFACEMQARVLNGADGFDALKGQGFSRAAKREFSASVRDGI